MGSLINKWLVKLKRNPVNKFSTKEVPPHSGFKVNNTILLDFGYEVNQKIIIPTK